MNERKLFRDSAYDLLILFKINGLMIEMTFFSQIFDVSDSPRAIRNSMNIISMFSENLYHLDSDNTYIPHFFKIRSHFPSVIPQILNFIKIRVGNQTD
jgi:hypothetical protein